MAEYAEAPLYAGLAIVLLLKAVRQVGLLRRARKYIEDFSTTSKRACVLGMKISCRILATGLCYG